MSLLVKGAPSGPGFCKVASISAKPNALPEAFET